MEPGRDMRVHVERKTDAAVAEHLLHHLGVGALLQMQSCRGVPEIMHPHSWQGLPIRVSEWKSLFERAGFTIVDVAENVTPFVTYVVRT